MLACKYKATSKYKYFNTLTCLGATSVSWIKLSMVGLMESSNKLGCIWTKFACVCLVSTLALMPVGSLLY